MDAKYQKYIQSIIVDLSMPYVDDFHRVCESAAMELSSLMLLAEKEIQAREAAQNELVRLRDRPVTRDSENAVMRELAEFIAKSAHPEDPRLKVADAIALHLDLGWPSANPEEPQ